MVTQILTGAAFGVLSTLLVALLLIATDRPAPPRAAAGLDFGDRAGRGDDAPLHQIAGQSVRDYSGPADAPLVIFVHGSGWHGQQFHSLATQLSQAGLARVLVPDLRGHGANADPRGDIGYIGQLEDDLAALIDMKSDGQPVVIVGHSSGGGLVVRMAGGPHGALLDGAVLLAPYLGHAAPSSRAGSGDWAQVNTRRIVGLSILNAFRIRILNHLSVIQFNFGALAQAAAGVVTPSYSYRLNTSYAPRRDWAADIAGLPRWHLVVGAADEAMNVTGYQNATASATNPGQITQVPDTGHLDIVDHPTTFQIIADMIAAVGPKP